ncbi:MAG TPA: hypothetical protein VMZ25_08150 [Terriglobales bacterium]|nr:hypothetical protein [Terriglobales bacterium]
MGLDNARDERAIALRQDIRGLMVGTFDLGGGNGVSASVGDDA